MNILDFPLDSSIVRVFVDVFGLREIRQKHWRSSTHRRWRATEHELVAAGDRKAGDCLRAWSNSTSQQRCRSLQGDLIRCCCRRLRRRRRRRRQIKARRPGRRPQLRGRWLRGNARRTALPAEDLSGRRP